MASTIVTKNSSTASAVPLTGDLTQGELAVNVTDKRLFTKDSGGTVVELGINPSSMTVKTTLKLSGSSSGYVALQGAAAAGSTTYTLPSADGTNGQALTTNGSGTLAWATISTAAATPTVLGTVYGKMTTSGASPYLTALGYNAAPSATGEGNTALGYIALQSETTGTYNTAIGWYALQSNNGGTNNTAVGGGANYLNTTGSFNTALGMQALRGNTTGGNNVAVGYQSLYSSTTASYNTAFGVQALRNNTTASNNTAVGYQSLYTNATGTNNTAIGNLSARTFAGSGGTFVGSEAGYSATSATNVTAVGYQALNNAATTGSNIEAFGYRALYNNTSGSYNVAVGSQALNSNTTASYNTVIGYQAAYLTTTAASNVILGAKAGFTGTNDLTTGGNNTFLGYYTQSASAGATYQIVIGNEVASQNSGGYVTIGDYSAKVYCYYRGSATWTQTSDATMKNVIGSDSLGLSFINRLNPVKFTWKDVSDLPTDHPRYNAKGGNDTTTVIHGLVAQEVKAALDAEGCSTFNGWDQGPDGIQAISRDMFITPLINAVKELKAELDAAKAEIALLKGN